MKAAAENGIILVEKTKNHVTIEDLGQRKVFEIITEFPFNSARKSQSVIIKDEEGQSWLFTKGADMQMDPKIEWGDGEKQVVEDHLMKFAVMGLRTLVMAKREISQEDCDEVLRKIDEIKA